MTELKPTKVRVRAGGRVVIPAALRDALGLKANEVLFAYVEDDVIHLLTIAAAMRRAQARVREFVPENVSLVDELIAERRGKVAPRNRRG